MLSEVGLNNFGLGGGIWTCLCGRVVSRIHLPTFILTCLWMSANESPVTHKREFYRVSVLSMIPLRLHRSTNIHMSGKLHKKYSPSPKNADIHMMRSDMDHYVIPADATIDIPQSTNKLEQLFELELKNKTK